MAGLPGWIGPTIAVSLAVIAASFLLIGAVALAVRFGRRRHSRALRAQLAAFAGDARAVATRLKAEIEGFADLSGETRAKVRAAVDAVEGRLRDVDALVEVLQEEAEETALDIAALLRTVGRAAGALGAARRAIRGRRGAGG
jgi:hypothetical protein